MRRISYIGLNKPKHFDEIYMKRIKKGSDLNSCDNERWELMLSRFNGGRLLDMGCGDSPVCIKFRRPDSEYWALDFAPETIKHLKEKFPEVNYICANCLYTPFGDEYFDYIVAGELVEHIEEPKEFFKEAYRILNKGGILAFSTPDSEMVNRESVSYNHIWSFEEEDFKELTKPFDVETELFFKEKYPKIIGFCKK